MKRNLSLLGLALVLVGWCVFHFGDVRSPPFEQAKISEREKIQPIDKAEANRKGDDQKSRATTSERLDEHNADFPSRPVKIRERISDSIMSGEDVQNFEGSIDIHNDKEILRLGQNENRPTVEMEMVQGQRHGQAVVWHGNGQKAEESTYVHGRKQGRSTLWLANGNKWLEAEYENGDLHGTATFWNGKGKTNQLYYRQGRRVFSTALTDSDLISTTEFVDSRSPGSPPTNIPKTDPSQQLYMDRNSSKSPTEEASPQMASSVKYPVENRVVILDLSLFAGTPPKAITRPEEDRLSLNNDIQPIYSRFRFNTRTGTLTVTVTLINTSSLLISGPIFLELENFSDGEIAIENLEQIEDADAPIFIVREDLEVGESTSLDIVFANTQRRRFSFDPSSFQLDTFLRIDQPQAGLVTPDSTLEVAGTVAGAITVMVNGLEALVESGAFVHSDVPLVEGTNTVVVTATDDAGGIQSESINVRRDTAPPLIVFETPKAEARVVSDSLAIAGTVNDIIPGATINEDDVTVTINGQPASVNNRTFFLSDFSLDIGGNTLTARALDRAGNEATAIINLTREPDLVGLRLVITGGNAQSAPIFTTLPEPLSVQMVTLDGTPQADRPVTFTISRGDGSLVDPMDSERKKTVLTDAEGKAQMNFTLGSRTGEGFHRVLVTTLGSLTSTEFCATAITAEPINISMLMNPATQAVVGQPLTQPIGAYITDAGGNPVNEIPVVFQIQLGGGNFGGQPTATVLTNADGIAEVSWTIGPEAGISNNEAIATFSGYTGFPVTYITSGVAPGPLEETTVFGIVQDSLANPIVDVKAVIRGTELEAFTGADGTFIFSQVPPGGHHVGILGSAANDPENNNFYPDIDFGIEVVSGVKNQLDQIVVLPFLDMDNAQLAGGDQDVELMMADVEGFAIKVFAHSTFVRDPNTGELVQQALEMSSSQVKIDKIPMPPPQGSTPMVVGTLQPAGVFFDPPAQVTYPNAEGLASGDVADIFAFHHDIGQFVNIGPGTVSEDGDVIISDPGFGIVQSGWHCLIRIPGILSQCTNINGCDITSLSLTRTDINGISTALSPGSPIRMCIHDQLDIDLNYSVVSPAPGITLVPGTQEFISEWIPGGLLNLVGTPVPNSFPISGTSANIKLLAGDSGGKTQVTSPQFQFELDDGSEVENFAICATQFDIDVVKVDLDINGIDEADEETKGGFVCLNTDNDNKMENTIPDKDETGPVTGEDDLLTIKIDLIPEDLSSGVLKLEPLSGGNKIKVWATEQKGSEIPLPKTWNVGNESIPPMLYIEGFETSGAERDVELRLRYTSGPVNCDDIITVTVVNIDLDIDSDNDSVFAAPDGSDSEDAIENIDDDSSAFPGKIICVSDGDSDNDNIPDFADGFDLDGVAGNADDQSSGSAFVPLDLVISDAVDLSVARISIEYSASDPSGVSQTGTTPDIVYSSGNGLLRIWTENGGIARDKTSVTTSGDYISPGTYDPADLGFGSTREKTFYIEAINPASLIPITVTLDTDGPGPNPPGIICTDIIRVTNIRLDLDVDTDNDNGLASPDRSPFEDQIENFSGNSGRPGKLVVVNNCDLDNDGVPGFADGIDIHGNSGVDASINFVPIEIELPSVVDLSSAQLRIVYAASDPASVTMTGTAPVIQYAPAPGNLRVWTKNGDQSRNVAGINASSAGDYVPSGIYPLAGLGLSNASRAVTLFVEGISPSSTVAAQAILVELDLDGTGNFICSDAVRLTVFQPQLQETRFSAITDDTNLPPTSASPTPITTEFHHLGIVTPLVIFDDSLTSLSSDTVDVSGRVISPLDLLGTPSEKVLLTINGEIITPTPDGQFSHTVELLEAKALITATGYNVLGGFGQDAIQIDEATITPRENISFDPEYQRILIGDSLTFGSLLAHSPITLRLKDLNGTAIDSIEVNLMEENGMILSEPFLISELGEVRNDSEIAKIDKVLKTPPPPDDPALDQSLYHNVWGLIDGVELFCFELAGVRIVEPRPYSMLEGALDASLSMDCDIKLKCRNTSVNNFKGECFSEVADATMDFTADFTTAFPDPDSSGDMIAPDIPFFEGPNQANISAEDLDGRAFGNCIVDTFCINTNYEIFTSKELQEFNKFGRSHEDEFLNFKLKPGLPLSTINSELKRLRLIPHGILKYDSDSCDPEAVRAMLVKPIDGDIHIAMNAIEKSVIHADLDTNEQPHIAPDLQKPWPIVNDWRLQFLTGGEESFTLARIKARKTLNNVRRQKIEQVMGDPSKPSHEFFVTDMRIKDTNFNPSNLPSTALSLARRAALIAASLDRKKALDSITNNPPIFRHGTSLDPSYQIRSYQFLGVDQKLFGSLDSSVSNNGIAPRIQFIDGVLGDGNTGLQTIITDKTKGVIIFVHGFNNDDSLEESPTKGEDVLRTLFPFSQYLYRTHGVQGQTPTLEGYVILHVSWTGNYKPDDGLHEGLWFNWDDALGRDTGRRVLAELIRDIAVRKDQVDSSPNNNVIDDPDFAITLHGNSLGNRVVVSALDEVKSEFNGIPFTFPQIRYILGHPAIRQPNVEDAPLLVDASDTFLQQEMSILNAQNQKALMFFSPFDKPGVAFNFAQGVQMLGRCGLPSGYNSASATTKVEAFHANALNQYRDIWHVKLMGWTVPGYHFESRPTYTWNTGGPAAAGVSNAAASTARIIVVKPQHISPVWDAIADYVKTGSIPIDVSTSSP